MLHRNEILADKTSYWLNKSYGVVFNAEMGNWAETLRFDSAQ
jgi:hypothetical protein